mmetsp:Transcript_39360/g.71644  ORF Transcript_39360/g.71644 Transcript_39360/m.71644 type:complete len:218 (-) Transcript_39360:853-1506(-)
MRLLLGLWQVFKQHGFEQPCITKHPESILQPQCCFLPSIHQIAPLAGAVWCCSLPSCLVSTGPTEKLQQLRSQVLQRLLYTAVAEETEHIFHILMCFDCWSDCISNEAAQLGFHTPLYWKTTQTQADHAFYIVSEHQRPVVGMHVGWLGAALCCSSEVSSNRDFSLRCPVRLHCFVTCILCNIWVHLIFLLLHIWQVGCCRPASAPSANAHSAVTNT